MRQHGILWDNDGVLVDTERLFYQANRELFAEFGIELTPQHFFDWFLVENYGAWHLLSGQGVSDEQIRQLRAERNRRYSARLHLENSLAIEHIAPVLAELARQARMGIVTSASRQHFDIIHAKHELLQHFEFVVAEEDYVESKPSPEPYLLGLQKLGLPPEQCLVIEDSPRGLQAALAAGLRCLVIRSELTRGHQFAGAHQVVDSVPELLMAIQDHWRS
ncbi:MAG: HAD family phosphatase [Burkholderiales bacterium]|nr:HAD family phosphatase [Burkholderiales bacterium]